MRYDEVHGASDKAKMDLAADAGAGVEASVVDTASTPSMNRLVGVMCGSSWRSYR